MKKKVLFVAHHLTIGGVQKSLISALKVLDYDKYDVTLYLRKNRLDLLDYIDKRVNVIVNEDSTHYYALPKALMLQGRIKALEKAGKDTTKLQVQLADFIRAKQFEYEGKHYFSGKHYDVAISYLQGYEAQFVAEMISADRKAVFYHGSEDEIHDIHNKVFSSYEKIIGVNKNISELLKVWYPEHKDRIIYIDNYVDSDYIIQQSVEFSVDHLAKTVLASCGRLAEVKGFDIALGAAKILKDKDTSFYWFFVGDGPDREKLEKSIKEYGLENNIFITGMQKNPYPCMRICDIYVQPSRAEAMPLTILEAQVLNKPVVTTKTVGGMNIVRDGVTGVQTEIDPASLAEGIEKLIGSPDLVKNMIEELKKVDYSAEKERYKSQWAELLEG